MASTSSEQAPSSTAPTMSSGRRAALWALAGLVVVALAVGGYFGYQAYLDRDLPRGQERMDVSADADSTAQQDSADALDKQDPSEVTGDVESQLRDLKLTSDIERQNKYFGDFSVISEAFTQDTGQTLFAIVPVTDADWFMLVGPDLLGNVSMWGADTIEDAKELLPQMISDGWGQDTPDYQLVTVTP